MAGRFPIRSKFVMAATFTERHVFPPDSEGHAVRPPRMRLHRSLGLARLAVLALSTLTGCARVAPYDRGKIAHPSMSTGDLTGVGEAHVYAVHEGAVGGGSGAGGGCGCN